MASVVQKITLASSRDIPFNRLLLSQSNVRRIKAGVSIEELAEDTETEQALAGVHGIRSIPTMVLLSGGREVKRVSGAMDARRIVDWARE